MTTNFEIYRTPEEKHRREVRVVNEQIEGVNNDASKIKMQSEKLIEDSGEALKKVIENLDLLEK